MRETYIPQVMATGMFTDARIFRILHDNEDNTTSYSIQYPASSIDSVQQYLEVHSQDIVEAHRSRFRDKHVAFMTLLEEI